MRTYGIDAHLLSREQKDGVPRYAQKLLTAMMQLPLDPDERIVLYGHKTKPDDLILPQSWSWNLLSWPIPRGWTHGRLSLEMLFHPPSVLFVPGHEVPMFVSRKTKVITTLHDIAFQIVPDVYEPSARKRQDLAVRRALQRAQMILTPSQATKDDLANIYHVDSKRMIVTLLAATIDVVQEDGAELLRKIRVGHGQYVFAMSRLEKKKNTLLLVRSFAALKRKLGHGHPLTLVIAGTLGFGEIEILRAIREEGIESEIRLLGYVSDRDASILLQHALCFAFPSKAEGFGIPLLEAMHHGVPVIASNIPSTKEVAQNAAFLISQNDVAAFTQGLESLLLDSALRDRYIEAGKRRESEFSWEKCAQQTLQALREVIR